MKREQMSRETLIGLIQKGMRYPTGTHRFWVLNCIKLIVGEDGQVILDEYEGFRWEEQVSPDEPVRLNAENPSPMFHLGRSKISSCRGRIIEEPGGGWDAGS